jgi:uncharacterized repeat protein (TIGR03803 family)
MIMTCNHTQRRMQRRPASPSRKAVFSSVAACCLAAAAAHTAHAATVETLYTFTGNGPDGYDPSGGLIRDQAGNLFGVTLAGGDANKGVVYELSPPAANQHHWRFKRLYSFQGGADGYEPNDGLIQNAAGDLIGVTTQGGASGDGTIFALTPSATDPTGYTKATLYSFSGADGANPYYGLSADGAGNFYGTTTYGGSDNAGTIFTLKPPANGGGWTLTKLHDFVAADGTGTPVSALTVGPSGILYGTGLSGKGAVYAFTPDGKNGGSLSVLYAFLGLNDGQSPYGGVTFTPSGDLIGTTFFAGVDTYGSVYELIPAGTKWHERTVAFFNGGKCAGSDSKLLAVSSGKVFGTGGNPACVFALDPRVSGKGYVLHSITKNQGNTYPSGALIAGPAGELYGVNQQGGNIAGQVFQVHGAAVR